jgi:hypothetical protein
MCQAAELDSGYLKEPHRKREIFCTVCTENSIRIDWGRESPNVGAQ